MSPNFIAGLPVPPVGLVNQKRCDYLLNKYGEDRGDLLIRAEPVAEAMQAAGRILRQPTDVGAIILGDFRYDYEKYWRLIPPYFQDNAVICQTEAWFEKTLKQFWKTHRY